MFSYLYRGQSNKYVNIKTILILAKKIIKTGVIGFSEKKKSHQYFNIIVVRFTITQSLHGLSGEKSRINW